MMPQLPQKYTTAASRPLMQGFGWFGMGWVRVMLGVLLWHLASSSALGQHRWVREYYDFEKKFIKQEYVSRDKGKHVPSGLFMGYYPTGGLQARGHYADGKQDGFWEYFYQSGGKKATGRYENAKKQSVWKYYYETGKLSQQGSYTGDEKSGLWTQYYESGIGKSEGAIEQGQNQGLWNYYREDGSVKAKAVFDKGEGMYEEYFVQGGISSTGLIKGGVSDSVWIYYYPNGRIKAQGLENNGKKAGLWHFYHPNGTLMSEGEYQRDQEEGEWRYYHPNGQLSSKGVMAEGHRNGQWNLYYESGKFLGEGVFDKGNGPYKEFYEDGKLKTEGRVENQDYTGEWKYYARDGILEGICLYKAGEGDYTGYYPDGSKKISGKMKNGQKTGVWRLYDPDGALTGLYKTYFDKAPIPRSSDTTRIDSILIPSIVAKGRPAIIMPTTRSRYFAPRINEINGYIISINPVAVVLGQLPITVERYWDRRLGYEAGLIIMKDALVTLPAINQNEVGLASTMEGLGAFVRQKLYSDRSRYGVSYIGQEVRYTGLIHKARVNAISADSMPVIQQKMAVEHRGELSVLVGKRFFKEYSRKSALCLDLYLGIGVGFRVVRGPKDGTEFRSLSERAITLPVRLGGSLGYFF